MNLEEALERGYGGASCKYGICEVTRNRHYGYVIWWYIKHGSMAA